MSGADFSSIGKMLMVAGFVMLVIGAILTFGGKFLPLGRLPGDILIQKENSSFFFPITTSIVLSIVLTVILNLLSKR
ncbi:MAG: DUF2905 domain-containing protein [Sporomusaceae bacterium]|nr:DUF2905 domain-containing protein [Sporomusaceae bacterium]